MDQTKKKYVIIGVVIAVIAIAVGIYAFTTISHNNAVKDAAKYQVYFPDGLDSATQSMYVNAVKGMDGVVDAKFVSEEQAKKDADGGSYRLPCAYIIYAVNQDADKDAVNKAVFALDGLADKALTESPAFGMSYVDGEGNEVEGIFVRVDKLTTDESGMQASTVDFYPVTMDGVQMTTSNTTENTSTASSEVSNSVEDSSSASSASADE